MRTLAASLAAVVMAGGLAACSGSPPRDREVALARNLTVTLPPGSPRVSAQREPVTVQSRLARELAAPERITAAGRLPGRAVLTFHVGYVGGSPFLAWLDGGTWVPVPSTYNARAGTVSAVVPHFSTWAPFTWITSRITAWISAALRNISGLGTATDPNCGTTADVQVTDSNPSHHTVGACAEQAVAAGPGFAITRIANLRAYPVDLFYPPSVGNLCGEYGKCLQVTSPGDLWLRLGAALSPGSHRVMLPGSGTAVVITDIPPGKAAVFRTAVDSPAMLMAFLEAGVGVFAAIVGQKLEAVATAAEALDAFTTSQCVTDGWQRYDGAIPLAAATSLARTAFGCLSAVLPDILDKLGLTATGFVLGAFAAATGLVSAVFSSLWGEYDTVFGSHVLTVAAPPACPSPAVIEHALAAQVSWWRSGYTLPAKYILCVGPYVAATVFASPQTGARALLEQEPSGLKFLISGSGPICTIVPSDASEGNLVHIPPQYGHALQCTDGDRMAAASARRLG
jgi:hypothetical protein